MRLLLPPWMTAQPELREGRWEGWGGVAHGGSGGCLSCEELEGALRRAGVAHKHL
jgi:hypothetical protein|eukprot:COSAG01_NODE_1410_length_10411_cov_7.944337_5_plen_55_part_00